MAAKRTYILTSEIQRIKAKHPPFDLVLPDVPWEAGTEAPEGEEFKYYKKTIQLQQQQTLSDEVVQLSQTDPVGALRLMIGVENYEHLVAAGGSSSYVWTILGEASKATPGESRASDGS